MGGLDFAFAIHTFAAVVRIVNWAYRHVACMDGFVESAHVVFACFAFYCLGDAYSAFDCAVSPYAALYCHRRAFFVPETSSGVDLSGAGPFVGARFAVAGIE